MCYAVRHGLQLVSEPEGCIHGVIAGQEQVGFAGDGLVPVELGQGFFEGVICCTSDDGVQFRHSGVVIEKNLVVELVMKSYYKKAEGLILGTKRCILNRETRG